MHHLMHIGIRVGFVAVIAVLFTVLIMIRPGAKSVPSRFKIVGLLCVGVIIAGLFMSIDSLYAPPPGQ